MVVHVARIDLMINEHQVLNIPVLCKVMPCQFVISKVSKNPAAPIFMTREAARNISMTLFRNVFKNEPIFISQIIWVSSQNRHNSFKVIFVGKSK